MDKETKDFAEMYFQEVKGLQDEILSAAEKRGEKLSHGEAWKRAEAQIASPEYWANTVKEMKAMKDWDQWLNYFIENDMREGKPAGSSIFPKTIEEGLEMYKRDTEGK